MSQRSGSSINSQLFMSDPVPIRNTSNNKKYYDDNKFLVKGKSDSEDVLIINDQSSDNSSFQINRDNLKEILTGLKSKAHINVKQLNNADAGSFKSVIDAMRASHGSPSYNVLVDDVKSVFSDIDNVKPETVAAFFVGCYKDNEFSGPIGCSPKCAGSIPPGGTGDYSICEDLVLIYTDGTFNSLNNKQSKHAYIYISDPDFTGFTTENINHLRDSGIEKVTLIFGNGDGSYKKISSVIDIDTLPVDTSLKPRATSTTMSNNTAAIVTVGVIILIIIIIVLLFMFSNSS